MEHAGPAHDIVGCVVVVHHEDKSTANEGGFKTGLEDLTISKLRGIYFRPRGVILSSQPCNLRGHLGMVVKLRLRLHAVSHGSDAECLDLVTKGSCHEVLAF